MERLVVKKFPNLEPIFLWGMVFFLLISNLRGGNLEVVYASVKYIGNRKTPSVKRAWCTTINPGAPEAAHHPDIYIS